MDRNFAFTLAEVLITLTIVGVIAAITIPSLMTHYQKLQFESALKKNYSVLAQALNMSTMDGGDFDFTVTANRAGQIKWFNTYLAPFLKYQKMCAGEKGCWHNEGIKTKYLNGDVVYQDVSSLGIGYTTTAITVVMADGSQLAIDYYSSGSMSSRFGTTTDKLGIGMYLDVNGSKGPNIVGKDIYVMGFTDKGLNPACNSYSKSSVSNNCKKGGNGICCLKKAMLNGWKLDENILK